MHGIPKEFDATIFVNRELESITFASNAIHLDLGAGHAITAQKHLRYRVHVGSDLRDDVLPVGASSLVALVGRRVERTEVRMPGDLILHFEDGGVIWFEDDSVHYESYSILTPHGEVFV